MIKLSAVKQRIAFAVVALMLLGSLLAACGGEAASTGTAVAPVATDTTSAAAPTSTTAAAGPTDMAAATPAGTTAAKQNITLTYIASQGWIQPAEMDLAKQFEAQTGIHIDYQIIPADQYFTVLQTKLNSGEGPDIFGGQSGKTDLKVNYNAAKNAVDLSDQEWIKREDPAAVDQTTVDGKVYGLTIWDPSRFVIVYNKDIFQKLGLSVPHSYAEFKAAAQKIKDSGVTPVYEPVADGWHQTLWFAEDGPRYEEVTSGLADALNANKATFAGNPTMLQALTELKEMYDLGFFGDNTLADTVADTDKNLAEGKYAMVYASINEPASIEAAYANVKAATFGFFPNPLADNQISGYQPAGPSKFIYSGSKHIDAAKQYFEFLTQPANLQYLLDHTAAFSNLNFPAVKSKYTDEQKAFLSSAKSGVVYQIAVNYLNPQWIDIGKDVVAMFTGAEQPLDVLKAIDQRRATQAQTAKDPAWSNP
jgi:raffinose/stachyose/melibiose transport system substrate-binding protein